MAGGRHHACHRPRLYRHGLGHGECCRAQSRRARARLKRDNTVRQAARAFHVQSLVVHFDDAFGDNVRHVEGYRTAARSLSLDGTCHVQPLWGLVGRIWRKGCDRRKRTERAAGGCALQKDEKFQKEGRQRGTYGASHRLRRLESPKLSQGTEMCVQTTLVDWHTKDTDEVENADDDVEEDAYKQRLLIGI